LVWCLAQGLAPVVTTGITLPHQIEKERIVSERSIGANGLAEGDAETTRGAGWLAAGGVLGAIAASSCCIVPLVFFSLGASGAWVGNLAAFAAYQPYFIPPTLVFLGVGFYLVYRKPQVVCTDEVACAHPLPQRLVKTGLWSATLLTAAALAFPYVGPWLLGVE
jgi:mercuric ion transport protein